ncbi:hypothetical protein AB0B25_30260 [Nocardia sp. NPDC049190]
MTEYPTARDPHHGSVIDQDVALLADRYRRECLPALIESQHRSG